MRVIFTHGLLGGIYTEPDEMNSRRLTISYRYAESRARPAAPYVSSTPMPFLRLQGRWLDEAGFAIGAQVRVEVDHGRLVVEVINSDTNQR